VTTPAELLLDAFGRLPELVAAAVDGLTAEQLAHRLDPGSNSIGWLVWHLARVEDASVAEAFGADEVWTSAGWQERLDLPLDPADTGYGHDSDAVAAVRVGSPDLLVGYYDAVHARTTGQLSFVTDVDLDRVVDTGYDPPVTLGVRLVSVLEDALQHVGQASLLRGVLTRGGR
jgi:hypothetical protein